MVLRSNHCNEGVGGMRDTENVTKADTEYIDWREVMVVNDHCARLSPKDRAERVRQSIGIGFKGARG